MKVSEMRLFLEGKGDNDEIIVTTSTSYNIDVKPSQAPVEGSAAENVQS